MALKKFIFFICEEDGRSRTIINGVVTSVNTPTMLPQAPDGSQEITIGWERSLVYHGNVRNFGLPFGFIMSAAKMLRNDFYKFNIDRKLYLLIKRLTYEFTATTFKEYYKQFIKLELDFSTAEDNQGEYRFEIGMMDGGLQKLMKAAENTKFSIPLDSDAKNVKMDGMFIIGNYRFLLPEHSSTSTIYVNMSQLSNDNPIPGLAILDVVQEFGLTPTIESVSYFAEAAQDIENVNLSGILVDTTYFFSSLQVEIIVFNTIADAVTAIIDLAPNDPYPQNYDLVIDETFDMAKGDRLFLRVTGAAYKESNLAFSAKSKPLQSYIKAFTLYDAWRKVTEKATGNADNFQSTLLENTNILLTSGDGVRGLAGAAVQLSIKELWQATDTYLMAGLQISDKVRIEGRSAFYTPESVTPAVELGEVKKFKCNPATNFMGTSIKVGHAEQQVDDTNGKYDFNGFQIYTTPIKRIASKELLIQSPYKAGPYEIEQTRANYEGKTTTDKSSDNDVFAIAAKPDTVSNSFESTVVFSADGTPFAPGEPMMNVTAPLPVLQAGMTIRITGSTLNDANYTIKSVSPWFFGQLVVTNEALADESTINVTIEIIEGQYYTLDRDISISQLTDPDVSTEIKETVYNVPLSPKRILAAHYPWLAGVFYGYAPESLIFESANRNKDLIAGGITEKANVPIASMGSPMFIPKIFEFETVVPVNIVEVHTSNPNPVFGFLWEGIRYTGFQLRDGFAASTQEEQEFKLLACPDNIMNNLI